MSRLIEYITSLEGAMSDQFRRQDRLSMYEIWNMVVEKAKSFMPVKFMHHYERYEDMSQTGRLQVFIEDDGDVILTIIPSIEDSKSQLTLSVQFCTLSAGGGKSPNVRQALLDLARAIEEDNILNPISR